MCIENVCLLTLSLIITKLKRRSYKDPEISEIFFIFSHIVFHIHVKNLSIFKSDKYFSINYLAYIGYKYSSNCCRVLLSLSP